MAAVDTVKSVFFMCALFRDLDDVAKIKGHKYSKYHAISVYLLSPASKNEKNDSTDILNCKN